MVPSLSVRRLLTYAGHGEEISCSITEGINAAGSSNTRSSEIEKLTQLAAQKAKKVEKEKGEIAQKHWAEIAPLQPLRQLSLSLSLWEWYEIMGRGSRRGTDAGALNTGNQLIVVSVINTGTPMLNAGRILLRRMISRK
ncbi:hypothetical protein H5410_002311 [Solanum commersonii]|uniref:Uncharacterized protein n=1 Tax=Solanum commersonii TaxID=4109 RepID=A0A9J6B1Z7_SOLCO|nr:hypothetical protein H5410_002311 [Solanum commersonii]